MALEEVGPLDSHDRRSQVDLSPLNWLQKTKNQPRCRTESRVPGVHGDMVWIEQKKSCVVGELQ